MENLICKHNWTEKKIIVLLIRMRKDLKLYHKAILAPN